MKKEIAIKAVALLVVIALCIYCYKDRQARLPLEVSEHLEEVVVTVDEVDITLREMTFYIAYQEKEIQEEAVAYNEDNPKRYWNAHTNGSFVRTIAEEAAVNMAVHDEIFYQLAMAEGITLNEEEEAYLANEVYDFCSDLTEEQFQRLGVSEAEMEASMRKIALANKYQSIYAQIQEVDYSEYDYTSERYETFLAEHEVSVNEKLWDRVVLGKVTVNYE